MTKEGFEIWIYLPLPLKSMPSQPTLVFSCRPDLKYNTMPFDYYFLINYMSMGINSSKSVQLNRTCSIVHVMECFILPFIPAWKFAGKSIYNVLSPG